MDKMRASPFFSCLFQVFFSVIALGGLAGFGAILPQFERFKKEGDDTSVLYVFLILTAALVAVGLRGIFFTRRELESDPDIRRLALRSPQENILGGLLLLALGVAITVLSEVMPQLFGRYYVLDYGAMIVGAVRALVGASQRATTGRE